MYSSRSLLSHFLFPIAFIATLSWAQSVSITLGQESDAIADPAPLGKPSAKPTKAVGSEQADSPDSDDTPKTKTKKEKLASNPQADPQPWAPRKMQMRFGMQFHSEDNYCSKLFATIPFPRDWPEQKITIVDADLPQQSHYKPRILPGGTQQLLIEVPSLGPQQQLDVVITVEVEKSFLKVPEDTSKLVYPKKTLKDKDLNWFMGDSPSIETKSRHVKEIAKEIKDKEHENAWKHVEAIYDWVRENIAYRNGPLRSTKEALKDKYGDCEEMSGIFVALCRASNIPARCVWIPEHCYPEFYLEDENGFGHWYPCQVAGDRQFGEMKEYRPILQKGDRFKVPELQGLQRYVAEHFTCRQKPVGPKEPHVVTIRDLGELEAELERLKASTEPKAADAAMEAKQNVAPEKDEDEMDTDEIDTVKKAPGKTTTGKKNALQKEAAKEEMDDSDATSNESGKADSDERDASEQ